jgi:hypothetical protein
MKQPSSHIKTRSIILPVLVLALVVIACQFPGHRPAVPQTGRPSPSRLHWIEATDVDFPTFFDFSRQVRDSNPAALEDQAIGIYVPGVLALPILQQPADQPYFVSTKPSVVTQFRMALQTNTIGLLAHNNLAGALFSSLAVKQNVFVVFGSGAAKTFTISAVKRFQALQPESPFSNFVDLDHPGAQLASAAVFNDIFSRPNRLIFQTCIANQGNASWGRLFVIAEQ